MSDLLLILLFAVHLLAANLAMAGPLVAIWLEWRATKRGDVLAGEIGRRLAIWSIVGLVAGALLGLAIVAGLGWLEPPAYREAFDRVPAGRWWSAVGEVAFYLICIGLYAGLWNWFARLRWLHRLLAVLAVTDFMYHFPPLFAMISEMSLRPDLKGKVLDASLYRQLMLEGDVLSRVVHHWLSAVAIAAIATMILAMHGKQRPIAEGANSAEIADDRNALVQRAARVALFATMLQIAVGAWVLIAMPDVMQNQLLGEDWLATGLFGASVIAALWLMHQLSILMLGRISRPAVYRSAISLVIVVCLMVATLHRARQRVIQPPSVSPIRAGAANSAHSLHR
jgi:hypothetical protein